MIAIICAVLSGLGFYFSIGLGEQWWLAWLAPIPILWLAFKDTKGWTVFLLSWAALGGSNIVRAYGATLPVFVLALGICGPALLFAVAVMPHVEPIAHWDPSSACSALPRVGPRSIFCSRSIPLVALCRRPQPPK